MPRFAYPPDGLPEPASIAILSEDALLDAIKAGFVAIATEKGLDVSGIVGLEGEPGNIQLQARAFRETVLRAAINDAVKANLIHFAAGADLDQLGAFYDAERLEDEADAAYRARILLAIRGRSPAGGEHWYESAARRASARVADVAVYRPGPGPTIRISVLATDNGGVPDETLLAAVEAEVTAPTVRTVNDVIEVEAATKVIAPVTAQIWLLPEAPAALVDTLGAMLDEALAAEGGLGFDLTRSWLTSKLHVAGVQKVVLVSPVADIVVDGSTAVAFGTKTVTLAGRAR